MMRVREAVEDDVTAIREVFRACYGETYSYPQYYDLDSLRKMVFADDTVLLVAEDAEQERVLGTASVIVDIGAHGDLLGEFGRLAVHPEGRNQGVGHLLMEERLSRIEDRLHIAVIENRVMHPFSQIISDRHGFSAAGFLPMKMLFADRESIALYVRHFGDCLALRKNHPRVVPEAFDLAEVVLDQCGCPVDVIADVETESFPHEMNFELQALSSSGYTSLLRLERGRVQQREIFGPVRLHTGLFQMRVSHAHYLLAQKKERIRGGVGYMVDESERSARIFELVSADQRPIYFLLSALEQQLRERDLVDYIEVDVNAHAPAMQRVLVEIGFQPVGYLPAMVFDRVERLDALRMARLLKPLDLAGVQIHRSLEPVAHLVLRNFATQQVLPQVLEAARVAPCFEGLSDAQVRALAAVAEMQEFTAQTGIFAEGEAAHAMYVVLAGSVDVVRGDENTRIGIVRTGGTLGEGSFVRGASQHVATALAGGQGVRLLLLPAAELRQLLRRRPDIAAVLYRNFASQLGEKLCQADEDLLEWSPASRG